MSTLRSTLQGLVKKDSEYVWTPTHDRAFKDIKEAICAETLLSYFDKSKPVFIEVDASGQGLGTVLLQGNIESFELENASQTELKFLEFRNRLRPIAFTSKSLSEAETRYSNIETELLGLVWAIEYFNDYTFANRVPVISDHKPLQPLFRWFKFTLKPPYSITHGKLRLVIWDTSFWTFLVKFGHKGP